MAEENVRIHILTGPAPNDPKTTIHLLKTIQIEGSEDVYIFPQEVQPLKLHTELIKVQPIPTIVKAMKTRWECQQVKITIPKTLLDIYFDKTGNARYGEHYLRTAVTPEYFLDSSLKQQSKSNLFEEIQKKPLQSITKDAVIEKFNGTSVNASTWIQNFERECSRLNIPTERYCEAMRLFLEGIAMEWYNTTWTLHGVANWRLWRDSFNDHFATKGWTETSFAYNYKHINGNFSNYAIKKLNLLANCDPELTEKSKIGLVIAGLPTFLYDRIERDRVVTVGDLVKKLNQLERPFQSNRTPYNNKTNNDTTSKKNTQNKNNTTERTRNPNHKPCSICEKIGKPGRYHPESECKTKQLFVPINQQRSFGNNNSLEKAIKVANNTELEEILNQGVDQKN